VAARAICILGKYPPTQGGMSRLTYLIASQLSAGGYETHVVSDSADLGSSHVARWDGWDALIPPERASELNRPVLRTSQESVSRELTTIGEPRWTKLLSAAIEAGKNSGASAMMSVYLEPYAVIAGHAARILGIPHIVVTGGSDVGFLLSRPALREAYRQTLLQAGAVLCSPKAAPSLLELGVSISKLCPVVVPPMDQAFSPDGPQLDVDRARTILQDAASTDRVHELHARVVRMSKFDATIPTLGFYGKVGPEKGTYDLIEAASRLLKKGLRFNVLGLVQPVAPIRTELEEHLMRSGLIECTTLLPYAPYPAVPNILRSCTAVLCLESGFPISIHGPRTPAEVISCGRALVISEELRTKQPAASRMRDGENCYIYDRAFPGTLDGKLEQVITNVPAAGALAARAAADLLPHYLALENSPVAWPNYFDFLQTMAQARPTEGGRWREIDGWVHAFRVLAEVSAWPEHASHR
jgi:glycosyltransferase involved in cell wall biosynthesis